MAPSQGPPCPRRRDAQQNVLMSRGRGRGRERGREVREEAALRLGTPGPELLDGRCLRRAWPAFEGSMEREGDWPVGVCRASVRALDARAFAPPRRTRRVPAAG